MIAWLKLLKLQLTMVGGPASNAPPMSCFRTVDSSGAAIADAQVPHQIGQDLATKMYSTMAAVQTVDTVFYEAQRQVSTMLMPIEQHACLAFVKLETAFVAAGQIFILYDKRRRGSDSRGLSICIDLGRHCEWQHFL